VGTTVVTTVVVDRHSPQHRLDALSPRHNTTRVRHLPCAGKIADTLKGSPLVQPPNHNPPDSAQTARAHAFKIHVEPELQVLFRVALTLTGSSADAEDLVQETLIRAFQALDGFDGRYPRAWLLTILRNTNMNLHRRRRPDLVKDWATLGQARPAFGAQTRVSAEDTVLDDILSEDLETAVNSLDPRFRTVLLLVDVDRLTYAEAAEALGVPVGTIMSRLSRARDRVRLHLRAHTTPPGRTA
jgi:RNA polymerase sigma-70 factor (ECF subfamily)